MPRPQPRRRPAGEAALAGALAAVAGGVVMKLLWQAGERALPPAERLGAPTADAVDRLARQAGVTLGESQRAAAAAALYTGAMAGWGALFGVVQNRAHPPALAHGLVLGGLVYAANFTRAAGLTRQGIVPAFGDQTPGQRATTLAAHAGFGAATAAAYGLLLAARRR